MMAGMQEDHAHAVQHPLAYPFYHFVGNFIVGHVSPPDQHVRVVQHFLGQAVLRLVQGGGAYFVIHVPAQHLGDGPVDALGINLGDALFQYLMAVFVPDGNPYLAHGNAS